MTTRELYNATIKVLYEYGTDEAVDLMNEFKVALDKLDARNEKRKTSDSKEKREFAQRYLLVKNYFSGTKESLFAGVTRDEIAAATAMTPAQAQAVCKMLVASGVIHKGEAKVGKSKKVVYFLPEE